MFFTLEGVDGTGKSTVCRILKNDRLPSSKFLFTREPYDQDFAKVNIYPEKDPMTKLFGFLYDRAYHCNTIEASLNAGHHVICDRYYDSTVAYQLIQLNENAQIPYTFEELMYFNKYFLRPDHTYLLICDVDVIRERLEERERSVPTVDEMNFIGRVQNAYIKISRLDFARFTVLDTGYTNPGDIADYIEFDIRKRTACVQPTGSSQPKPKPKP